MKYNIPTTLLLSTLFLIGCGGSMERDAQKMADLQCDAQELKQQAMAGDMDNAEDLQELIAKAAKLKQKMNAKYSSMKEKQAFAKVLLQANAKCN